MAGILLYFCCCVCACARGGTSFLFAEFKTRRSLVRERSELFKESWGCIKGKTLLEFAGLCVCVWGGCVYTLLISTSSGQFLRTIEWGSSDVLYTNAYQGEQWSADTSCLSLLVFLCLFGLWGGGVGGGTGWPFSDQRCSENPSLILDTSTKPRVSWCIKRPARWRKKPRM